MKKILLAGAMIASAVSLAACGGNSTDNKASAATNSPAPAPANNAAPAPAAGNAAAPAASAGDRTNQNFTLNNRSSNTITHVYVSPVSSDNWGEDIMGQDVLAAGESVEVSFERAETECNWDIRVTIDGSSNNELRNVNLCTTTDVDYE